MSMDRRLFVAGGAGLGASVLAGCATSSAVQSSNPEYADPMFTEPYIDLDEWRDHPVRHRYVHGGFRGTEARFSFYMPPPEHYHGRFYQHITPFPIAENLAQRETGEESKIAFAIASGGYFIETNGGGSNAPTNADGLLVDPTIGGFRVNAACAQYSRTVAQTMYGEHRTYGYAWGGSGGAFRTVACAQNTNVWDGVVPYVMGSPVSMPSNFTVRLHAMRVLKAKLAQIADAAAPGGSGDIYAGLNDEEHAALVEVTRMGFPPRCWYRHDKMGLAAFSILFGQFMDADPTYVADYWSKPGYLGANPPPSLIRDRVQHRARIKRVITIDEAQALNLPAPGFMRGASGSAPGADGGSNAWMMMRMFAGGPNTPIAFQVDHPPLGDTLGAWVSVESGAAAGAKSLIDAVQGDIVILGISNIRLGVSAPSPFAHVAVGDELLVDNSAYLAWQTYHRHQVPTPDFYVFDQFRNPDGTPIYPQRPHLLGLPYANNGAGSIQNGRFHGKMILVESLVDEDAHPWQADWYRAKVKENLGSRTDDNFRLWFTDYGTHSDFALMQDPTETVAQLGVLQQALRDIAAWVERGVAPPANTAYHMDDGQVIVAPSAAERKGLQPVVKLQANGGARADVRVGEPVELSATIETPPGAGSVIAAEWDFEARDPLYPVSDVVTPAPRVTLTKRYTFSRPGTYFPTLRVTSHRDGDSGAPFARVRNLGRARVVVV